MGGQQNVRCMLPGIWCMRSERRRWGNHKQWRDSNRNSNAKWNVRKVSPGYYPKLRTVKIHFSHSRILVTATRISSWWSSNFMQLSSNGSKVNPAIFASGLSNPSSFAARDNAAAAYICNQSSEIILEVSSKYLSKIVMLRWNTRADVRSWGKSLSPQSYGRNVSMRFVSKDVETNAGYPVDNHASVLCRNIWMIVCGLAST